jgi:hypothetical protein
VLPVLPEQRRPAELAGATWSDAFEFFLTAFVGKPQKTG